MIATDAVGCDLDNAVEELNGWDDEELIKLKEFAEEAEGYTSEWKYGAIFVRDSYFEDFAYQEAKDCGLLENCDKWPATCIDWEQAANELKMDYISIEFDGIDYWFRSY